MTLAECGPDPALTGATDPPGADPVRSCPACGEWQLADPLPHDCPGLAETGEGWKLG